MKPPARWPLHPAPAEGEALSSWLTRIAAAHQLTLKELFGNLGDDTFPTLGEELVSIDLDPPLSFLDAVGERTGLARERLRGMTVAGLVPSLLDTLDPSGDPAAFSTYVHQHSVLLTPRSVRVRTTPGWRAWLAPSPLLRACPVCIADSNPVQQFSLVAQIPVTLSCPEHGCYLESIAGVFESLINWTVSQHDPRPAPAAVQAMDRRTHEALRTGAVALPRRSIEAGAWFRLLRTIVDELATFPTHARRHSVILDAIWDSVGQPPRGGQSTWRPYEALRRPVQDLFLEAAAAGIAMIESGAITPAGADGQLFLPEPVTPYANGWPSRGDRRPVRTEMSLGDRWKEVMRSLEEVIDLARTDPATADQLYRFLAWGPGGPDTARRLLTDLDIRIPDASQNNEPDRSRVLQ